MRKLAWITAVVSLLAFTACNTIGGVGEDVSSGGKTITKSADAVQKKL